MNKEQQELLDDAYKNYVNKTKFPGGDTVPKIEFMYYDSAILTQEEFIERVITNPDFAKQWGVTIYTVVEDGNIRIGINYNDKTIESYE
jgi:predicted adenine nucleotide alpha hydrolase (AANH) superfamily ATPase